MFNIVIERAVLDENGHDDYSKESYLERFGPYTKAQTDRIMDSDISPIMYDHVRNRINVLDMWMEPA